jgi:hypothetical protein
MNVTLIGHKCDCVHVLVFDLEIEHSGEIYNHMDHVTENKVQNICERKQQIQKRIKKEVK